MHMLCIHMLYLHSVLQCTTELTRAFQLGPAPLLLCRTSRYQGYPVPYLRLRVSIRAWVRVLVWVRVWV